MTLDSPQTKNRARDLGIPFTGEPGPLNAITDVQGVEVGHATIVAGEGQLVPGSGPVRTGVTAILPRGKQYSPVFAAWYSFNGNGELTGTAWIDEAGFLEGPILFTNTHSVGLVRDTVIRWQIEKRILDPIRPGVFWLLPVVGETYDGVLSDINGQHVRPEHVYSALDSAAAGPVQEGCVGGGTGMICHEFKGGIGSASRRIPAEQGGYTVGVLVQANHGLRSDLTIAGIPLGTMFSDVPSPKYDFEAYSKGSGSILVALATDAPLLPHQIKRLVRRVPLGITRVGSHGEHTSGDLFIGFSTANPGAARKTGVQSLQMLANDRLDPLFHATVQAVEEAIVNALVAAETTTGINHNTAYRLPHDRLVEILRQFHRLNSPQV